MVAFCPSSAQQFITTVNLQINDFYRYNINFITTRVTASIPLIKYPHLNMENDTLSCSIDNRMENDTKNN